MASAVSSPKRASSPTSTADNKWQTRGSSIRERNAFMFNNQMLSDVTFALKGEQWIPAHKYVLAISSPVFFALFNGDTEGKDNIIRLPDCEEKPFLEFLRYIYSDEIEITKETVHDILYLSKKYFVPSLTEKCAEYLERELNTNSVFHILQVAHQIDVGNLERRCWRLVDRKTRVCLQSEAFLNINRDILVSLLKRDGLIMTESDLFQHAKRWAEAQCKKENVEATPTGREMRRHLGNAILYFRFPLMKQIDFARTVAKSGILSESELLSAFLAFNNETGPIQFSKRRRAGSISVYDQIYAIRNGTCTCKCQCPKCKHTNV